MLFLEYLLPTSQSRLWSLPFFSEATLMNLVPLGRLTILTFTSFGPGAEGSHPLQPRTGRMSPAIRKNCVLSRINFILHPEMQVGASPPNVREGNLVFI